MKRRETDTKPSAIHAIMDAEMRACTCGAAIHGCATHADGCPAPAAMRDAVGHRLAA